MKTLILLLFFLTFNSISQTIEVDDQNFSPIDDYYKLNYLNGKNDGKGNTGIAADNDISAAYLNPASLDLKSKFQFNLQYSYKTTLGITIPIFNTGISYDLKHIFPVVYFGFGYRLSNNFQAGIIYSNPRSMKRLYTNGFETVDGQKVFNDFSTHAFGIPLTYKNKNLSFGIIADIRLYSVEYNGVTTINDPNGNNTVKTDHWNINAQFGIKYKPVKNLSLGVTFTPGIKKEIKYENEIIISPRFVFISRYPMSTGGGIEFSTLKNRLKLSADYNFMQMSKIKGYKDKHDINLGIEYLLNKMTFLRLGFFTYLDNRNFEDPNISFSIAKGEFAQYFITAGFTYKAKNFDISASVMDSHISGGIFKNTIINASILYNF